MFTSFRTAWTRLVGAVNRVADAFESMAAEFESRLAHVEDPKAVEHEGNGKKKVVSK